MISSTWNLQYLHFFLTIINFKWRWTRRLTWIMSSACLYFSLSQYSKVSVIQVRHELKSLLPTPLPLSFFFGVCSQKSSVFCWNKKIFDINVKYCLSYLNFKFGLPSILKFWELYTKHISRDFCNCHFSGLHHCDIQVLWKCMFNYAHEPCPSEQLT